MMQSLSSHLGTRNIIFEPWKHGNLRVFIRDVLKLKHYSENAVVWEEGGDMMKWIDHQLLDSHRNKWY
jgi:Cdc6-like AAA superfamily ATPase